MKLTKPTKLSEIRRAWHLVDANEEILGRVSSRIAQLLIGKGKPYYVPYLDCGDYVVVINAVSVKVTGKKPTQKIYMRYSGYPSGLKRKTYRQVMDEDPTRIIKEAVSGMLPKNKLRDVFLRRLYIFADEKHQYEDKFSAQGRSASG
jgi:large subunit ribosomal protein L13